MFRINQLATAKEDLSFYGTLHAFRHANSERLSFKKALRRVSTQWLVEEKRRSQNLLGRTMSVAAPARQTRSNVDFGVEGWCFPQTGRTPARNVAAWYKTNGEHTSSEQETLIKERRQNCPGLPFYRVGEDPDKAGEVNEKGKGGRGSCAQCRKPNSNTYCGLCHTWLCGYHVPLKNNSSEPSYIYCSLINAEESSSGIARPTRLFPPTGDSKSGTGVVFRNSCWHIWHREGYQKRIDEYMSSSMTIPDY